MGVIDPADLAGNHRTGLWRAYGNAKQANILFAMEAARRWPDIFSASYHPGTVKTRFGSSIGINLMMKAAPFLKTPVQGADTLVWLASEPVRQLTSGGYYYKRELQTPARQASDPRVAARLWDASMQAVGLSWH
jgi:NAD(P)-dependent dehydrogenase (short-subunit alcohol dehydrogenase family)